MNFPNLIQNLAKNAKQPSCEIIVWWTIYNKWTQQNEIKYT